jgi:hypothetical protein
MKYLSGSPGRALLGAALAAVTLASMACASLNRKEKGAAMDAAALGMIGNNAGSIAGGAIIGDGEAASGIISHQMDQQAKELKVEMPGAVVERVGEGIQVTFASGLLFDFDSDAIRPGAGASLRTLAASLNKYANTELLIVGHTDASAAPNTTSSCPLGGPPRHPATSRGTASNRRGCTRRARANWMRSRPMEPRPAGKRIVASRSPSTPRCNGNSRPIPTGR